MVLNKFMIDPDKIDQFITDRNHFSSNAFGTPAERDCIGPLRHLQEEVVELIENPDDHMEWADCFLLLLDAAWRKGHSVEDLFDFARQKLEINKKRTWAKKANGVYNHVK